MLKLVQVQKMNKLYEKSINQKLVDSFIEKYFLHTTSSLESLFNVCETLLELDESVKNLQLNESDLDYFCMKVGLTKTGSTYRKYVCIGKKVHLLRNYVHTIPSVVSTIYEICTLDSDKFEEMVKQRLITQTTTLNDLKVLTGKVSTKKKKSSNEDDFLSIQFEFDSLSDKSRIELINFFKIISSNTEFKITCPITDKLVVDSNNVIELETTEVRMVNEEVL
jgi:hypothetical protein